MLQYEVVFFDDNRGNVPVERFLRGMPGKARANMYVRIALLEEKGFNMPSQYSKKLTGHPGLWELKLKYRTNEYRIFYFFVGNRIVLLNGFLKKTDETPKGEIDIANNRMSEWKER